MDLENKKNQKYDFLNNDFTISKQTSDSIKQSHSASVSLESSEDLSSSSLSS
jgi:hypothetical protein